MLICFLFKENIHVGFYVNLISSDGTCYYAILLLIVIIGSSGWLFQFNYPLLFESAGNFVFL